MRTWGLVMAFLGILVMYLGFSSKSLAAWQAITGKINIDNPLSIPETEDAPVFGPAVPIKPDNNQGGVTA